MKTRWYHASPKRLPVGTILTGVFASSGPWRAKGWVFITAGETPHHTIIDLAVAANWHVYEVTPRQKKSLWGSFCMEGVCQSAQILRYVGSARGIVERRIRQIPKKKRARLAPKGSDPLLLQYCVASRVRRQQVVQLNRSRKHSSRKEERF